MYKYTEGAYTGIRSGGGYFSFLEQNFTGCNTIVLNLGTKSYTTNNGTKLLI